MWRINSIQSKKVEFDFASAELGKRTFTQIMTEETILLNQYESAAWHGDPIKFLVLIQLDSHKFTLGNFPVNTFILA